MRVTCGNLKRRYVWSWRVGQQKARRVMRGGTELWPGADARVRTVSVNASAMSQTLQEAYFRHALDAVAQGADDLTHVLLVVEGRTYSVGASYRGYPVVSYSDGVFDFGDDGPLQGQILKGDSLVLLAEIGERPDSKVTSVSTAYELPPLPGTAVAVKFSNSSVKYAAKVTVNYQGRPSRSVVCNSSVVCNAGESVFDGRVEPSGEAAATDVSAYLSRTLNTYAKNAELVPVYPAFSRVFELEVTEVTYE